MVGGSDSKEERFHLVPCQMLDHWISVTCSFQHPVVPDTEDEETDTLETRDMEDTLSDIGLSHITIKLL